MAQSSTVFRNNIIRFTFIILLALFLRFGVTYERALNDEVAFFPLPDGMDQTTYINQTQGFINGSWPTDYFYYQPGIVFHLAPLAYLTDANVMLMRLYTNLLGAMTCGLIYLITLQISQSHSISTLSGFIYALYPVAIFHSTDFLTEPIASFHVALVLLLIVTQRHRIRLWRSIMIGIVFALIFITRANLIVLFIGWIWYLYAITARRKIFFIHLAISFIALIITFSPITLWNISHGKLQLVGSAGSNEIYRANSRDASGLYGDFESAMQTAEGEFIHALVLDAIENPVRFVQLQLRKIGLFWSDAESGNNLDFVISGRASSWILSAIPLNFAILMIFGVPGLWQLRTNNRLDADLLTITLFLIFISVMVSWVEGRAKLPAIIPLIIASSFFINRLFHDIRQPGQKITKLVVPVGIMIAIVIVTTFLRDQLPTKYPSSSLPDDIRPYNAVFDDDLEFIGYRPLTRWPTVEQGWSLYNQAYTVELFWQIRNDTDKDYYFSLAYVQDQERLTGYDNLIGAVTYPSTPTSTWQAGEIYSEIVGFRLSEGIPARRSGEIILDVYTKDFHIIDQNYPAQIQNNNLPHVTLSTLATYRTQRPLQADSVYLHTFGDKLGLTNITWKQSLLPDEPIQIQVEWVALTDMDTDYVFFLHVATPNDPTLRNINTPIGGQTLRTSNWYPGFRWEETITIEALTETGTYELYLGIYDPYTLDRLLTDAPDNRIKLGTLEITADAH